MLRDPFELIALPKVVPHSEPSRLQFIAQQIEQMKTGEKSDAHTLIGNAFLLETLTDYVVQGFSLDLFPNAQPGIPAWVEKSRELIDLDHKNPNFIIGDIHLKFSVSPSHFHKHFKQAFAVTPNEYLNRMRIETAARLIHQNPTIKLDSLLRRSGYQSRSLFYRMFKRFIKSTPGAYRKNMNPLKASPPEQSSAQHIADQE